jgi:hypothetical protein
LAELVTNVDRAQMSRSDPAPGSGALGRLKSALRRSFPEAVSNGGWVVDWLWTLEEFGGSNFKLGSYQPGFSFATLPVTSIGP